LSARCDLEAAARPLAFAGLWDAWEGDGKKLLTYCILTTAPNEMVGSILDRQPVILGPGQHADWLDPATLQDRLRSFFGYVRTRRSSELCNLVPQRPLGRRRGSQGNF
jgi:putative SOS response-associated peptidase YedK